MDGILEHVRDSDVSRWWCCDYFSYASFKMEFNSFMARLLLTVESVCRGVIFPFFGQMSESVDPVVDEFVFVVQFRTVRRLLSDYFEYLSETSIGLPKVGFRKRLIPYSPSSKYLHLG